VAETHECGSSDPTLARPVTVVVKQLDRALSKVQNGIKLCWTTVTTTIGQVVDTRVLGKLDKWHDSGNA